MKVKPKRQNLEKCYMSMAMCLKYILQGADLQTSITKLQVSSNIFYCIPDTHGHSTVSIELLTTYLRGLSDNHGENLSC